MISTLAVLKKKMVDRPWLYEEEEHAVLKLAEDAVEFIRTGSECGEGFRERAWLEEHK